MSEQEKCVWRAITEDDLDYAGQDGWLKSACDGYATEDDASCWSFCPYCGNPIEVTDEAT